jgi:hypothetical protein
MRPSRPDAKRQSVATGVEGRSVAEETTAADEGQVGPADGAALAHGQRKRAGFDRVEPLRHVRRRKDVSSCDHAGGVVGGRERPPSVA